MNYIKTLDDQVQAGASGNFTVSCLVGDGLNSYSCSKRVSIVPVSPCTLTTAHGPLLLDEKRIPSPAYWFWSWAFG